MREAPTSKINQIASAVPGLQHAAGRSRPIPTSHPAPKNDGSRVDRQPENSAKEDPSFRSVEDARKEAQKAILRLWPLGVKYQHYIDEGFDQTVVKSLFDGLHLDISTGKPKGSEPLKSSSPLESVSKTQPAAGTKKVSPPAPQPPPAQSQKASKAPTPETMDKSESRKDRIARLLAEKTKSAKASAAPAARPDPPVTNKPPATSLATTTSQPTIPPPSNVPPPSIPTAPRAMKTREEKERLLQQKLEALQKSRELQAPTGVTPEKDALPDTQPNHTNGATEAPLLALGPSNPLAMAAVESSPAAAAQSSPPKEQQQPPKRVSEKATEKPLEKAPSRVIPVVPGKSPVSVPPPSQPVNQRKRPVAMDFIDYSSTVGPVKRPFDRARQDSSLVIDVSDDESDEEMDIDMDDDSLAETTTTAQRKDDSNLRVPSVRDFPPLTDTAQRQYSSPAPSTQTPPGSGNGRKRESELDRKQKEILEMRRKIAEAEAKRKAKGTPRDSRTPNPPSSVRSPLEPRDSDDSNSRPPVSRAVSASDADASDIPRVQSPARTTPARPSKSATPTPRRLEQSRADRLLQEKLAQLNRLKEEQARLQAEIEQSLAEKDELDGESDQAMDEEEPISEFVEPADPADPTEPTKSPRGSSPHPLHDSGTTVSPVSRLTHPADSATASAMPDGSNSAVKEPSPQVAEEVQNLPSQTQPQSANVLSAISAEEVESIFSGDKQESVENGDSSLATQKPSSEALPGLEQTRSNLEKEAAPNEEIPDVDMAMSESTTSEYSPQAEEAPPSDSYEPPGPPLPLPLNPAEQNDTVEHMALESPPFSPEPALSSALDHSADTELQDAVATTASPVPEQISAAGQPREAAQEIETEGAREVHFR